MKHKPKPKRKRAPKVPGQMSTLRAVREWLERGGVQHFYAPEMPGMVSVDADRDEAADSIKYSVRQYDVNAAADTIVLTFHLSLPVTTTQLEHAALYVVKRMAEERRKDAS